MSVHLQTKTDASYRSPGPKTSVLGASNVPTSGIGCCSHLPLAGSEPASFGRASNVKDFGDVAYFVSPDKASIATTTYQ